MSEVTENYYSYLRNHRRVKTIDIYKHHIDGFENYLLNKNKTIDSAINTDVIEYIKVHSNWNAITANHFLVIVKTFFNKFYLQTIEVGITQDELRYKLQREKDVRGILNIPNKRIEKSIENKALTITEIKTLLKATKESSSLDYSLVWFFLWSGFRKNEFLQLNPIKNIIWSENRINLTSDMTKTLSERNIYFDDYTKVQLINILKQVGTKEKLVPWGESHLNKVFAKYNDILGKHIFPHSFRHTFITEQTKAFFGKTDLDINILVKTLSGHSVSSDITARYTSISQQELKEAMIKYHYMLHFENKQI